MTSLRQIAANRRNASKSTGPTTEEGKQRSRCNALRHGLTAETVIAALEDADDYTAFEGAIAADYDAQSAVERELVLRLAGLLWRLRRATSIETGLFDIQASHPTDLERQRHDDAAGRQIIHALFGQTSVQSDQQPLPAIAAAQLGATLEKAKSELKCLVPEDAQQAIGHCICFVHLLELTAVSGP